MNSESRNNSQSLRYNRIRPTIMNSHGQFLVKAINVKIRNNFTYTFRSNNDNNDDDDDTEDDKAL